MKVVPICPGCRDEKRHQQAVLCCDKPFEPPLRGPEPHTCRLAFLRLLGIDVPPWQRGLLERL